MSYVSHSNGAGEEHLRATIFCDFRSGLKDYCSDFSGDDITSVNCQVSVRTQSPIIYSMQFVFVCLKNVIKLKFLPGGRRLILGLTLHVT